MERRAHSRSPRAGRQGPVAQARVSQLVAAGDLEVELEEVRSTWGRALQLASEHAVDRRAEPSEIQSWKGPPCTERIRTTAPPLKCARAFGVHT